MSETELFYFQKKHRSVNYGQLCANGEWAKGIIIKINDKKKVMKISRRLESASSLLVTRCDRAGAAAVNSTARHFDDQGNSYVVLLCDFRTS